MAEKHPLGHTAVEYGKKFLGTPYVWGGRSPGGFDCSGFTSYVYEKMGVNLPRTSAQQWAYLKGRGKQINEKDLQPGDLIFFGKGKVTDVKMYAGNGQLIGARGGKQMAGSVVTRPLHYRKDLIGYAAVTRNVNAVMPGATERTSSAETTQNIQGKQPLPPEQTKDPNALGTNNVWEKALKRQAILSSIIKPSPTLWQREPTLTEQELPDAPDFLNLEQGVL